MRVGGLVGISTILVIPTFRKQPMHNNGIEITKKMKYLQYLKGTKNKL